jgi:hypothetical protein
MRYCKCVSGARDVFKRMIPAVIIYPGQDRLAVQSIQRVHPMYSHPAHPGKVTENPLPLTYSCLITLADILEHARSELAPVRDLEIDRTQRKAAQAWGTDGSEFQQWL